MWIRNSNESFPMFLYIWKIMWIFTCLILVQFVHCQRNNWGLVYRIKQLRDLLVTNQPPDPHDPDISAGPTSVDDRLSNVRHRPTASNYPDYPVDSINNSFGNRYHQQTRRHHQQQTNHWRSRIPQIVNPSTQLTASMQRRYPYTPGSTGSSPYRLIPNGSGESLRWNHTVIESPNPYSVAGSQPEAGADPSTSLYRINAPVQMTTASVTDEFVGPDGKLRMSICDHPNGFLRRQKKLCRRYLHLMESVVRGYFMGLRECEYQFAAHRWNCQGYNHTLRVTPQQQHRLRHRQTPTTQTSQVNPVRVKTYLDKLLSKGTRESAYVLAVTSAGVSHAVTKACSSGLHENCGCDRTIYDHPKEPNFEWSGCSDNIHFGVAFSRQFLDVREKSRIKRKPKLAMTNLHNNHVGRQTVLSKMEVQCKCHGVSGSCEMRTCWRSLPKFRDLGAHLQERFHKAILVDFVNQQLVPITADEVTHQATQFRRHPRTSAPDSSTGQEKVTSPTEYDLLYITRSPTFCHHDPGFGSLGTHGRQCVENATGLNSCDYLCCGRGFKRKTTVREERCNCKFQWCCKVICQTCRKTVVVSTCN
ncbi:hypothetical protein EG68_02953 [Paragonimus skrjabini miyazakii]|uniref:Protein Wnt n=1 Tax=Paragonimus skrjabini miyazakii TaxID=59628 RepID=A0A8S9YZC3_9TREM|nr:hypothetical protein EG68_02953 [Paragonimus skrjabini miyazakii]